MATFLQTFGGDSFRRNFMVDNGFDLLIACCIKESNFRMHAFETVLVG